MPSLLTDMYTRRGAASAGQACRCDDGRRHFDLLPASPISAVLARASGRRSIRATWPRLTASCAIPAHTMNGGALCCGLCFTLNPIRHTRRSPNSNAAARCGPLLLKISTACISARVRSACSSPWWRRPRRRGGGGGGAAAARRRHSAAESAALRSVRWLVKPNVVFFGELLPSDVLAEVEHEVRACDLVIVAGTSLEVQPACLWPEEAMRHGAKAIVVNFQPTYLDYRADVVIREDVAAVLPAIVAGWPANGSLELKGIWRWSDDDIRRIEVIQVNGYGDAAFVGGVGRVV